LKGNWDELIKMPQTEAAATATTTTTKNEDRVPIHHSILA
jgi:hypothetical protein